MHIMPALLLVCYQAALFWTSVIACLQTLQKGISPATNHNDQAIIGSDPSSLKYSEEGSSYVEVLVVVCSCPTLRQHTTWTLIS
jgi:hypothetical protein